MSNWKQDDWCKIQGRTDGPYRVLITGARQIECQRLDGSHFSCPATLPYHTSAPPDDQLATLREFDRRNHEEEN